MKMPETKAEFAVWRASTQLGWIIETMETKRVEKEITATPQQYVRYMAEKIIEDMEILKTLVDTDALFS
jgi:hypothetical protein